MFVFVLLTVSFCASESSPGMLAKSTRNNSSWISLPTWKCLHYIVDKYLRNKTLYMLTEEEVPPTELWPKNALFISNDFAFHSNIEADVIMIVENLSRRSLREVRGRCVIISKTVANFTTLWERYRLVHVIVIIPYSDYCEIYSWADNSSNIFMETLWDVWKENKFVNNANLFPIKVPTFFKNKTLKFMVEQYPLFTNPVTFNGPEDKLIKLLTEQTLVNIERVILPNKTIFYEDFKPDGTLGGFISFINNRSIDFAYGCISMSYNRSLFSISLPSFDEEEISWSLAAPKRAPLSAGLHSGFSKITWLLVLIAAILFALLYITASYRDSKVLESVFMTIRIILYQGYKNKNRTGVFKGLIVLFNSYSLHICWFYQATLLLNIFREHFENEIRTIEEAINAGLVVVTYKYYNHLLPKEPEGIWDNIYGSGKIMFVDEFYNNSLIIENSRLIKLGAKSGDLVDYLNYKPQLDLKEKVRFLKEPYSTLHGSILMPLAHPLFPYWHTKVRQIIEGGLFQHWFGLQTKLDRRAALISEENRHPLQWENVSPTFQIWGTLLLSACCSLFIEIVVAYVKKRISKTQHNSEYWSFKNIFQGVREII